MLSCDGGFSLDPVRKERVWYVSRAVCRAPAAGRSMTLPRALVLACLALGTALGCASGSSCPDSNPLDCGNGACCDATHVFQCGSKCWVAASAAADGGCTNSVVCKSTDATVCYADWNCTSDAQCATGMRSTRGVAGPFGSSAECESWRTQHAAPTSQCYCR
jgi:hypothetical protein